MDSLKTPVGCFPEFQLTIYCLPKKLKAFNSEITEIGNTISNTIKTMAKMTRKVSAYINTRAGIRKTLKRMIRSLDN